MLKGIDVSEYQRSLDFNILKNSLDFIIARASYGTGYTDNSFAQKRDGLRNNNIPHGFYHYAYPQYNSPQNEANWFIQVVSPQENELLCLDFEENWSGDVVGWCKTFLDTVSAKLNGYKPLVYLNLSTVNRYDWSPVINAGYGLWLANWDNNPNAIPHNTAWSVVAIRQYTDAAQIPGVSGNVDADVFYGDLGTFKAYGYHPTPISVPTPPIEPIPPVPQPVPIDETPPPPATPPVINPEPIPEVSDQDLPNPVIPPDNLPVALPITTSPSLIGNFKSRKFILSILGAAVTFLNSKFNLGLTQDQLVLFLLPLLSYIIVEGIADIIERSKMKI